MFAATQPVGYNVTYSGGSLSDVKGGQGLKLFIAQEAIRFDQGKITRIQIPPTSVSEVSFGKEVHRRVGTAVAVGIFTLGVGALIALSKSKKHHIGLVWDDAGKKGGLVIQADKNEYRGIIAALEGVTGKKAVNTDEADNK
jgi:hypothetical protein